MRNDHTTIKCRDGSEFSGEFNQTVSLFEKMEAPFEKIAPLFFRKVPLNFAKQVVLLQVSASISVCGTMIQCNSYAI